jgi:predicted nucleic acid-binding protein
VILLDSTVIVGFLDADDAVHEVAVAKLKQVGAGPLAASVISYAELLTGAARRHHDHDRVEGFFDQVISALLPVDRPVAARAASLRARNSALRMPDALILATADNAEAIDTVLCADRAWPKFKGLNSRVELLQP